MAPGPRPLELRELALGLFQSRGLVNRLQVSRHGLAILVRDV